MVTEDSWVFDTGPLRHFAAHGWLGVLRFLAGQRQVFIPDAVEREINAAAGHVPAVRAVLDADWIHVHRSADLEFGKTFAHFADRLVADGKNVGECGVLAMGQVYKCEVVIDEPRHAGSRRRPASGSPRLFPCCAKPSGHAGSRR